jgi:hypothetical protein
MPYEQSLAAFRAGDDAEAERLAALDLSAAEAADDAHARVDALCMLARVALRRGDLATVAARAEEAEQIAQSAGDRRLERMPLHLRAVAARMTGRAGEGRQLYLKSIALNESLGESAMAAAEHRNLAYLELRAGDVARARELFAESARRFDGIAAAAMAPYLTFDRATVATLDGDLQTAAALLLAAERQWQRHGVVPDPDDAGEVAELKRVLAAAGVEPPS